MQLRHLRAALVACTCALFACDDATDPSVPGTIAIAAGDAQVGPAGETLPIAPSVRVLDERGRPLGGVAVEFRVTAGEGAVANARSTTDDSGVASAGAWTLGPRLGANTLTGTVAGLPPVTFGAAATPGAPASIIPIEGDGQSAPVGTKLPIVPTVRAVDAFGNPTPGVPVRFAPQSAGGRISVSIAATDVEGIVRGGTWTLDTIAGPQTLRVFVEGGPSLDLVATAAPLAPIAFDLASPAQQTGTVGDPADAPPAVVPRDRFGNAVPGITVRFVIVSGEGTLHAADSPDAGVDTLLVIADPAGNAAVRRWTFGTRAGPQSVRAAIVGDTVQALFSALAAPGPPTGLAIAAGQDQSAQAGTIVAQRPTVSVADAYANPIVGLPVTFTAVAGGGIVNLAERTTGADGRASPLSWILGLQPGPNMLVASSPGLPDAVFHATGTTGESFEFDFFFINAPQDIQDAMRAAALRWQDALLAGQPDAQGTISPGFCGPVEQVGPYDDLRLILLIDSIDGPGSVLASAGPCAVRASSRMPVVGGIALDEADVPALLASGQLTDVLVHEIGHILGIGTRWGGGLLVGSSGDDPWFAGTAARAAFADLGGDAYTGLSVPVENTGGSGTRNGHWRETVFRNELMTGFINAGANPLSSVSFASLQDIGYMVDTGLADAWTFAAGMSAQSVGGAVRTPLLERPWPHDPVTLDPVGGR